MRRTLRAPRHGKGCQGHASGPPRVCRGRQALSRKTRMCITSFLFGLGQEKVQHMPPASIQEIGWRTDFADSYAVKDLIGQGSFGLVYAGQNKKTGFPVAIKTMPKVRGKLSRSITLGKISKEVCLMQKTQSCCTGVVQLIDCFEETDSVHLVTELCPGGDLKRYVETHGTLDEYSLAVTAAEIFQIIKACHSVDILYADVKPANFCIVDEEAFRAGRPLPHHLKAIDFGCSQHLTGETKRSSKRSGTLGFLAPEVFTRDYSHKAEVWSAGVTLYWLFSQRLPFWANDQIPKAPTLEDVTHAVTSTPITYDYGPWLNLSPAGLDFMRCCLTRSEEHRMGVDQALMHPWLLNLGLGTCRPLDLHATAVHSPNHPATAASSMCPVAA